MNVWEKQLDTLILKRIDAVHDVQELRNMLFKPHVTVRNSSESKIRSLIEAFEKKIAEYSAQIEEAKKQLKAAA